MTTLTTVENVQDYPHPPALKRVPQTLRVLLGGNLVVETTRGYRVLETHHAPTYYLPPEDILRGSHLRVAARSASGKARPPIGMSRWPP